jgi:single-strand DNA-binding protein
MNLNTVILSGFLTSDPAPAGNADQVATFSLSFLGPYGSDRPGGARRRDYVSVVAFGKTAELCLASLKEGSKVVVDGRLRQDRWGSPASGERSRVTIVADRVHFVSALKKTPRQAPSGPEAAPASGFRFPATDSDSKSMEGETNGSATQHPRP